MMINEAVLCLQENILQNATDGDLGAVLGLGFPPFLGGPFRYTDLIGVESFVEMMNSLHSEHGDRFKPAELLLKMKSDQSSFHQKK
jgi:3-hydroxyacyl-CoA dehydrogenase/enoyl-CoA hydratase/3-hydroxybutyryl-CoA epimerase